MTLPEISLPSKSELAADAAAIFQSGVEAVQPAALIARNLRIDGGNLLIGGESLAIAGLRRVVVIGAGKASGAMAAAVVDLLQPKLASSQQLVGWVNVPDDCRDEAGPVRLFHSRPAGSNLPTDRVIEGTRRIVALVESLRDGDLCICLISGGGSALLAWPLEGISLEEKRATSQFLSARGASIQQLNRVRRQLSQVKGGRLLNRYRGGRFISLILSDVLGDPLELIASGPTVHDPQDTRQSALAVFDELEIDLNEIPRSVRELLSGTEGPFDKDPAPMSPSISADAPAAVNLLVGSLRTAVEAAVIEAKARGYRIATEIQTRASVRAEDEGRRLAEHCLDWSLPRGQAEAEPTGARGLCLISGGEPVVQLGPHPGQGGRNQQLVLSALEFLAGRLGNGQTAGKFPDFCLLSAGTDGEDGNTTVAGAIIDGEFIARCLALRLDPTPYLGGNDAYHFFETHGGLVRTGPTGTNVGDLRILLVREAESASKTS